MYPIIGFTSIKTFSYIGKRKPLFSIFPIDIGGFEGIKNLFVYKSNSVFF